MDVLKHRQNNRGQADSSLAGKKKKHHHLPMPETVANEKPTENSISSYVIKPKDIHFETQERKEKIVILLRRHLITNLGWVLLALLLSMLPLFLDIFPVVRTVPIRFQAIFVAMWYLFVIAYVFEKFLSWYYNVYIITDERIVDVDFHSVLYKEISQAKIDNIQDVTFVMGGLTSAMFNYGTVYIQTAGEQREFDFDDVPHPNRIAKIVNELILEEEKEKLEGRAQ
jgi:membrane protein YdbS with pleckstrin-like domain